MFVDGLDEFDGRYNAVIETIKSLSSQTHFKICLSSRPLVNFEKAFTGTPSLRLQDLTFKSILAYANLQLFNLIEERFFDVRLNEERARFLLGQIVTRAQGVFLWAVIAIKDVRGGLQDMADLDELAMMIDGLPAEIDDLYMRILRRIKPVYRREAIRFLQIVIYAPRVLENYMHLNLYLLYFIEVHRACEDVPLSCSTVDLNGLVKACDALKTRVLSHTLGLLDLVPQKYISLIRFLNEHDNKRSYVGGGEYDARDPKPDDADYFRADFDLTPFTTVLLHHRTVEEFLLHNKEAKAFVAAEGLKEEHLHLSILRGFFAYLVHISQDIGRPLMSYLVKSLLKQLAALEKS